MEPQPNSTTPATGSLPVRRRFPRASRSAVTNDPRFMTKGPPTPRAMDRRRRDLVEAFMTALGGAEAVSPVVAMQVRRAAELITAAEMCRANMLNGVPTDMLALVRLEGVAARACRMLNLKIEPVSKTAASSLALEMRRARWAEAERRKSKSEDPDGEATG